MVSAKDARIWFWCFVAGVVVSGFMFQILVAQYIENRSLNRELRVANQALQIEAAQTADMMYQLQRLQTERDVVATQNFVAGATAVIDSRNRYSEVWHAGYDRGSAVQQYANSLEPQTATQYTGSDKE